MAKSSHIISILLLSNLIPRICFAFHSTLKRSFLPPLRAVSGFKAREIIDSRGNPTIEVDVTTNLGTFTSPVPSGASTGAYEAFELRDGGSRYLGKGVLKAIANVNDVIGPKLIGLDPTKQSDIDEMMVNLDGTSNKRKLGANAILGVSLAMARAGAAQNKVPLYQHIAQLAGNDCDMVLPTPSFNVINGGSHAGNKLAFQEYFVIPTGAESFREAMQIGSEVYHHLAKVLRSRYGSGSTMIGDEGGFAPPCDERSGLELIMEAIQLAKHQDKCSLGLDVAASEFKIKNKDLYNLDFKFNDQSNQNNNEEEGKGNLLSGNELISFYNELVKEFPIVTIEDPFDEDDWSTWSKYNHQNDQNFNNKRIQIVADDLTVTNPIKINKALETNAANALLLKLNQIGTLTESIQAVKLAKKNKWGVMTSHRSGETEDSFIADLAVGLCTGQIKSGAPCRSERLAKYNRLLRIEEELGSKATYAGSTFHSPIWMA